MEFSADLPIWSRLDPAARELLRSAAVFRSVPGGTVLSRGSADCTGLLLIHSGQLRAYILSEEGREITLYRLFGLDLCLFSASCAMRSIQFDVTIEAEKDSQLWIIPPDVYRAAADASAPLANYINEVMAARFSEVLWLMEQILWKSLDRRLAGFLLQEAALEGSSTLRTTHETIGSHLGSPREVITRMLRYFQSEGLVKLSRGQVELTNQKRLAELAGA